jgi:hypothetical protein
MEIHPYAGKPLAEIGSENVPEEAAIAVRKLRSAEHNRCTLADHSNPTATTRRNALYKATRCFGGCRSEGCRHRTVLWARAMPRVVLVCAPQAEWDRCEIRLCR